MVLSHMIPQSLHLRERECFKRVLLSLNDHKQRVKIPHKISPDMTWFETPHQNITLGYRRHRGNEDKGLHQQPAQVADLTRNFVVMQGDMSCQPRLVQCH